MLLEKRRKTKKTFDRSRRCCFLGRKDSRRIVEVSKALCKQQGTIVITGISMATSNQMHAD